MLIQLLFLLSFLRSFSAQRGRLPQLQGVQGFDDDSVTSYVYTIQDDFDTLHARYSAQAALMPGLRRYNFFWASLENSLPPSLSPLACPPTHLLVPANEKERQALGYNEFHCYSSEVIARFDVILALDASIGAASAFIMYGTPDFAAHPNCTGFPWPPNPNFRLGCLPWAAQESYYDFVLFVLQRWRAPWGSGGARLSALCIWNEVQSLGWSDPSPYLPNRQTGGAGTPIFTPSQLSLYASIISNLTTLAGRAALAASPADPAFMFLSTDHFMKAPSVGTGGVGHLGLIQLLDAMWPSLWAASQAGQLSWGLAVHPYDAGDPRQDLWAQGIYTFATLERVSSYQCDKLVQFGVPRGDCGTYPETQLWASEQGWPTGKDMNKTLQGRNICFAHALALQQGVWAVTHNLFQSVTPSNQGGGGDFSLLDEPPVVDFKLDNGKGRDTYDAYAATAPAVFGRDSNNYCCVRWRTGCSS